MASYNGTQIEKTCLYEAEREKYIYLDAGVVCKPRSRRKTSLQKHDGNYPNFDENIFMALYTTYFLCSSYIIKKYHILNVIKMGI